MIGRMMLILWSSYCAGCWADLQRSDMALRHTLFEQWQGNFDTAYVVAEHYKKQGLTTPELILSQAAASFELGYGQHGKLLLEGLDESRLLPENQSRLHVYLARDAYRRRDWPLLAQHLDQILESDDPWYVYLQAEQLRTQKKPEQAYQLLLSLQPTESLRWYGLFNLASDRYESEKLLLRIDGQVPVSLEQRMIQERAMLALADIYWQQQRFDAIRTVLSNISVEHKYGPAALVRLGLLAMQLNDYEHASRIWFTLQDRYPSHRESSLAFRGLGSARLKTSGDKVAYRAFKQSLMRLEQQQHSLKDMQLSSLAEPKELLKRFVHQPDYLTWLAEDDVQSQFTRWQSLTLADRKLGQQSDDVTRLAALDVERRRRIESASRSMSENALQHRSLQQVANLQAAVQKLSQPVPYQSNELLSYATENEQRQLQRIRQLASRGSAHEPHALQITERIERLEGLVRYGIFVDLAARKQARRQRLEERLVVAKNTLNRVDRIQSTAVALKQGNDVSQSLAELALDLDALKARTQLALEGTEQQLLASLNKSIENDTQRLDQVAEDLRYDMVRVLDQQFLAEAAP